MKFKLLSKKVQMRSVLRKFGITTTAFILAVLMADTADAQTIFSNPVGINVGSVAAGRDLHVNGPIRFNDLAGTGTRVVTCDPNGDLGFTTISGTLPTGTSPGQSLLWDGSNWINNDYLRVNGFGSPNEIFEIGITAPVDFVRTIHYGGNVALDLDPGTLGNPSGTWMSHGWRATFNSLAPGDNFTGTRVNWQDFAGTFGLTDRNSGPEIDMNFQLRDFTVAVPGDPLTNRMIFSGSSGPAGGGVVNEWATILGNGFMGVGTPAPLVKFEVNGGRIGQVSQGTLGPPIPGNRWSSIGDRLPFAGGPGIISTGLRTQWDEAAINVGLTPDPTGTTPFAGLISWQDATAANPPGTGDNSLIFGARDNTTTNFFERMRITWDGQVGIGTNSPTAQLQVEGGSAVIAQVSQGILGPPASGRRWCAIGDRQPFSGGTGIISTGLRAQWDEFAANFGLTEDGVTGTFAGLISWQDATGTNPPGVGSNPLIFGARDNTNTNFFERMRIDWNGHVGINTSTPITPTGNFELAPGGPPLPFTPPVGDVFLSVNGTITTPRDVVAGGDVYAASDARFKKDFSELKEEDSWKKVLNITPYSYKFDAEKVDNFEVDDRLHYGFKAQDVAAEIPELTKQWGKAYVVNYQGFVPFLTAGIQEHETRLQAVEESTNVQAVEALEAKNAELEAKNNELEARLEKLEGQLAGICNLPCVQDAINQNTQEGELNDQPQLFQNEPNPFGSKTTIKYYVPANANNAAIKVVDNSGKQLGEYQLKTGKGQLEISAGTIPAGSYNYSLYIDNNLVDTKKMVIVNY